jgi:hypothetical protein
MNLLEINHENKTAQGFSIGAYLLMVLASNLKFKKIILISPTPLFHETVKDLGEIEKLIDIKQSSFSIKELCKKIDCEVEIYIGENEVELVKNTASKIAKELGIKLKIVKGANHGNILKKMKKLSLLF